MIDLYSVSPKLSTSVGEANGLLIDGQVKQHNKTRINIDNLCKYVLNSIDYQFKFVYSGKECIDEIEDIYDRMKQHLEDDEGVLEDFLDYHPDNHTMLMPEGITNEQLAKSRIECAEMCVKKGWDYTDRTHIIIWGDKRGV